MKIKLSLKTAPIGTTKFFGGVIFPTKMTWNAGECTKTNNYDRSVLRV